MSNLTRDESRFLLFGSGGMLGQYFVRYLRLRGITPIEISRTSDDPLTSVDLEFQPHKIENILLKYRPSVVINCAALVSLQICEDNPDQAYKINAESVKHMVDACAKINAVFLQVSTDHFYNSPIKILHCESHALTLLNEYARSKKAGEDFAMTYTKSIIVRTNITGFRGRKDRFTFIEWLLMSIRSDNQFSLYTDYYTSTIDCRTFCSLCYLLLDREVGGIFNLAASDSVSKYEFGLMFANAIGIKPNNVIPKSATEMFPPRALNVGLDCTKVEKLLNLKVPSSSQVVQNLAKEAIGKIGQN